eukprot:12151651-Ditylum_brightwellii.AAC.1
MLVVNGIWEGDSSALSGEDVMMTPLTPRPCHITKLDVHKWHTLSDDARRAWKYRAKKLNKLPLPGVFTKLPVELSNEVVV